MARGSRNLGRSKGLIGEEKESSWISYTDLMSALLIIFALVIMVTMYDTQNAYEQQKKAMDEATEAIKQKEEAIAQNNKLIEDVIGVKSKIIEELMIAFKDSNLDLQIDKQTGAIRFSGGVFFDKNSSKVSAKGVDYLEDFIPKYIEILMSDQFRDEIAQIIVEGHTDSDGGYLYNLQLSQDRALAVAQQVFAPNFPKFKYQEELKTVITANGRSFSVPILDKNGEMDPDKSRRVEFKFRLKDEQLLEKLQGMMVDDGR
ncbi:OmpA family protein [Paenibacillus sp. FSL K6-1566]|uniref:OmpA family protein n=1 Tax=Paenibacillus sp. FSL K6-1566 TaxID=2954515 RepID=UPI00310189B1